MDLSAIRQEYSSKPLDIDSVCACPFEQFEIWFGQCTQSKVVEPNAMVLSTLDQNGFPTQRSVLLKYFEKSGFVFFTNGQSRKARHIAANPRVSLLFPWYELQRQIEINGIAEQVSAIEAAKYFALRPRGSQLGAWVSHQSKVDSDRSILQKKLLEVRKQFAKGQVPKPPSWGGFRVIPERIEFWQGGKDRLHDRIEYVRSPADHTWNRRRLSP